MRTRLGTGLACFLALGCAAQTAQETTATSLPPADTTAPALLVWSDCDAGLECAQLAVPIDHADPGGPTLALALARQPAGEPDARVGSLLFNPGGPGASAIEYLAASGGVFDGDVTARFDVVAMDPRGVGASRALGCGLPEVLDPLVLTDQNPDTPAEESALHAAARGLAEACAASDGDILPTIGTENVARDMDLVRAALGGEPISYVGFSWGTQLGLAYAELFPAGLRAYVLDGVVDPSLGATDLLAQQAVGFESALNAAFDECAADPDCPLAPDPAAAFDAVAAALEEEPLPATDRNVPVGPAELQFGAAAALYSPGGGQFLLEAVAEAAEGDGTTLGFLADAYTLRQPDGRYETPYLLPAYVAVSCVDALHPQGEEAYTAYAEEVGRTAPRLGEAVANGNRPCAFWPAEPSRDPHAVTAPGAPPALVIGKTGDTATPFVWAQRVAETLAAATLLTHEGEGHTSYGESACVDDIVHDYLIELTLPAEGMVC